ncbi:MAG: antitoxin [Lysobacterales bacterium]|nr:MAG: antitoxin [Xanthomonadales bacterium]
MERVSLFKSNQSQALRLPKAVAYPESVKHVDIVAIGRARLIAPAGESWDSWFDDVGVSDDFMERRDQPAAGQEREAL